MKKLLLIDAYAMIFRAFYAMIRNPRITSSGIDTSAVFGFVNILQDLLKREQPSHIAVCFDPGGKTFRHEVYPEYKANRSETPEGIIIAVPYIKRILEAYRIPVVIVPGYEADDVIGTLAHMSQEHGFETYMVTGDKDFAQLVTPHVKVLNPGKGEILGVEEVKEKYGLSPNIYIRSFRLKQAAYLLVHNHVNVSEVAYKVGFSTHSYFSSSFREYFGLSPKEFVSTHANDNDEEKLKKLLE